MKVAVHHNPEKDNALEYAKKVCKILLNDGAEVTVRPEYREKFSEIDGIHYERLDESVKTADFAVAVGGDGTMLRCAKKMIGCKAKLIGVNTGRLGFMASLETDQLEKLLLLKNNEYELTERMLLHGILRSGDEVREFNALNDINISGLYTKICDFKLYSGEYQIGSYRADGIIFSTPTGSTAYALSAGGPVIEPDLECIEMTLVCPHSLFSRATLFSPDRHLTVECTSVSEEMPVYMSFDGEEPIEIKRNSTLEIYKSQYKIPFVDFFSRNAFHDSLSKKLMQSIK